jgi:hypothetical protein
MKKNNIQKNNIRAITIVETLITLLAISIMIAGPIAFVAKSFTYTKFLQSKTEANALAQEGIELVTSLRNYNSVIFKNAIDTNCLATGCLVDWNGIGNSETDIRLSPCIDSDESCRLYKINQNSIDSYRHAVGTEASDYLRQLKVIKYNNAYIIKSRVWSKDASNIPLDITLQKTIFIFD